MRMSNDLQNLISQKDNNYLDLTYKPNEHFNNNLNNFNRIVLNQNIVSSTKTINNINFNGNIYENNHTMMTQSEKY